MEHTKKAASRGEVSVFSLNTYLVPGWLVSSSSTCKNQDKRALALAKEAAKYDFVALQEVWGSQVDVIEAQLSKTHAIRDDNRSSSLFGFGATLLTSMRYWFTAKGGLWSAAKNEFAVISERRFAFTVSETRSRKGVEAITYDLSPRWGNGKVLMLANVHLDPMRRDYQLQQLREAYQTIKEEVALVTSTKGVSPQNLAVLLCGDFNIDAIRDYKTVQKDIMGDIFNSGARDLHREFRGKERDLTTFDQAENSLVEWPQRDRLDYCFAFDSMVAPNGKVIRLMSVKANKMEVLKQAKGSEWSDHWGHLFHIALNE